MDSLDSNLCPEMENAIKYTLNLNIPESIREDVKKIVLKGGGG